jgi:hypothetical protein
MYKGICSTYEKYCGFSTKYCEHTKLIAVYEKHCKFSTKYCAYTKLIAKRYEGVKKNNCSIYKGIVCISQKIVCEQN